MDVVDIEELNLRKLIEVLTLKTLTSYLLPYCIQVGSCIEDSQFIILRWS